MVYVVHVELLCNMMMVFRPPIRRPKRDEDNRLQKGEFFYSAGMGMGLLMEEAGDKMSLLMITFDLVVFKSGSLCYCYCLLQVVPRWREDKVW